MHSSGQQHAGKPQKVCYVPTKQSWGITFPVNHVHLLNLNHHVCVCVCVCVCMCTPGQTWSQTAGERRTHMQTCVSAAGEQIPAPFDPRNITKNAVT